MSVLSVARDARANALIAALTLSACVPTHDDDLPNTAAAGDQSEARLRLLIDQGHRSGAHVVPVVIEAQRRSFATDPQCISIVGFPGTLDLPLGADCPTSEADDSGATMAQRAVNVCVNIDQAAAGGWFEGVRLAAYHPSQREETFTAFAQLHSNAACEGAPLAEVAVVVRLGQPAPATPDAALPASDLDAAPPPEPAPDAEPPSPEAGPPYGGNDAAL